MPDASATSLGGFGGFLRCEKCYRQKLMAPGASGGYISRGWPRCCGYTMRWWTQQQIDANEVPAAPNPHGEER